MEQVLLKDILGQVKKEVIGNKWSDQSYFTKLTAVGSFYLDFSKASSTVSFKILGTKLSHSTVDGWADR